MGAVFIADLGDPNQVVNGVSAATISPGTAITSVSNALGGQIILTGNPGTGSLTVEAGVDSTPLITLQGNASLLSPYSSVFTSTNGNSGKILNGAWGLNRFSIRALIKIRTVPFLSAGLLVGVSGHVCAQLAFGGTAFGGNGSTIWIGGNGASLISFTSQTDLPLPTTPMIAVTLTYAYGQAQAYFNGKNLAPSGVGVATNWGAVGGIADPGFGLGGMTGSETFGTGGGTQVARLELYPFDLSDYQVAILDAYAFSLLPSQQL